jgi:hypothetical protein
MEKKAIGMDPSPAVPHVTGNCRPPQPGPGRLSLAPFCRGPPICPGSDAPVCGGDALPRATHGGGPNPIIHSEPTHLRRFCRQGKRPAAAAPSRNQR